MKVYSRLVLLIIVLVMSLTSCESEKEYNMPSHEDKEAIAPKVILALLRVEDNPGLLIEDVEGKILGDSLIEFWVPYLMQSKQLIPTVEHNGSSISWNIDTLTTKQIDFRAPVQLIVHGYNGEEKNYLVHVRSFTGLPVMWLDTENDKEIDSKQEYVNAHMLLIEDVITRSAGSIVETDLSIKCRGNSSFQKSPKKSYRLKFPQKVSLLDEPDDKAYVMIANYFDKTMVRNILAYYMGKISNLDYTPSFHFVEMILNGRYNGTYMLGDKLKISDNRVNVGKDGFLLEFDSDILYENDGVFFNVDSVAAPVHIKDPDVEFGDENYLFIENYLKETEKALFSDDFKDPQNGWQKYLDITSFVDWFIINEIAKNADSETMGKSCYLNLKRGGKLKMGPLWDFDQSFGNQNIYLLYTPEGFVYVDYNVKWIKRLFEDTVFKKKVKERFLYFYNLKNSFFCEINANAQYLKYSVIENESRWHTINVLMPDVNRNVWGSYENEIQYLKDWLNRRLEWMKTAFEKMN